MGHRVNLGYIILNHMIACCERKTRALPYGWVLTKVYKEFGLYLSSETNIENVSMYDMYKESTMGRMKFVKSDDDKWIRMGD